MESREGGSGFPGRSFAGLDRPARGTAAGFFLGRWKIRRRSAGARRNCPDHARAAHDLDRMSVVANTSPIQSGPVILCADRLGPLAPTFGTEEV
jgi:hypothetical protein